MTTLNYFGSIQFSAQEIEQFKTKVVPNGGGALKAENGNVYIFTHCHEGLFFYNGEWLNEKTFIAEIDSLCHGVEQQAFLVCCDPGRFTQRTLKGKYVSMRHVLADHQFPKGTKVYTPYSWGGDLKVETDKPPIKGWRALLNKRIF